MHGTSRLEVGGEALMKDEAGSAKFISKRASNNGELANCLTKRNQRRSICSKNSETRAPYAIVDFDPHQRAATRSERQ
jgi:hypothetical protein